MIFKIFFIYTVFMNLKELLFLFLYSGVNHLRSTLEQGKV